MPKVKTAGGTDWRPDTALAGLLLSLVLLPSAPAAAQTCYDCGGLSAAASALTVGESLQLRLDFDADKLPGSTVADAYLGAVLPDNSVHIIRHMPDWRVQDIDGEALSMAAQDGLPPGEYQLHFTLVPPGEDPLDPAQWLSSSTLSVALLPTAWEPEAPLPPVPVQSGALPPVVSHGGADLEGLRSTHSLEALDRAWQGGQRLFELDFSWTADRHLVLMTNWQTAYRRLFGRNAEGVPRLRDFLSMPMNRGLTQLDFYGLLDWLEAHPEARVIIHVAENNLRGLEYIAVRSADLQDRFLAQIVDPADYEAARALGYRRLIYRPRGDAIAAPALLDFVAERPLAAVALPYQALLNTPLGTELAARNVFVYAHNVNHPALAVWLRGRGASGVYSDLLPPLTAP